MMAGVCLCCGPRNQVDHMRDKIEKKVASCLVGYDWWRVIECDGVMVVDGFSFIFRVVRVVVRKTKVPQKSEPSERQTEGNL